MAELTQAQARLLWSFCSWLRDEGLAICRQGDEIVDVLDPDDTARRWHPIRESGAALVVAFGAWLEEQDDAEHSPERASEG